MKSKLSLTSFCLKNFKAVQNSKTIKFTLLTAFIGNNGSGKSSIVEAMETLKQVANVATLPGILKASLAMPDMHWGYRFPLPANGEKAIIENNLNRTQR